MFRFRKLIILKNNSYPIGKDDCEYALEKRNINVGFLYDNYLSD